MSWGMLLLRYCILLEICFIGEVDGRSAFQFQLFQFFSGFHFSIYVYITIYILSSYIVFRKGFCTSVFNWNYWNNWNNWNKVHQIFGVIAILLSDTYGLKAQQALSPGQRPGYSEPLQMRPERAKA